MVVVKDIKRGPSEDSVSSGTSGSSKASKKLSNTSTVGISEARPCCVNFAVVYSVPDK